MKYVNEDLWRAAAQGDEAELKALLADPKCDPMSKSDEGFSCTALMWAVNYRNSACVELLLPVSDVLAQDFRGETAWMKAAHRGELACVQMLLPRSDAQTRDNQGMSALMHAASNGETSCVEFLLTVSDVIGRSSAGISASDHARVNKHNTLADFIDAYAHARDEVVMLRASTDTGTARKTSPRRV